MSITPFRELRKKNPSRVFILSIREEKNVTLSKLVKCPFKRDGKRIPRKIDDHQRQVAREVAKIKKKEKKTSAPTLKKNEEMGVNQKRSFYANFVSQHKSE